MAEFQALLRAKAEWKPHQIAKAGDIGALAEAAKDQKDADKLLGQEKYFKMIRAGSKLLKHSPEMDKFNEQRKFNQRKKAL